MKKIICCLVFFFLVSGNGFCNEKKVTIANLSWLPYSGQFLPGYGVALELVSSAFKHIGYKTEFYFMSWGRALEEVKNGKFDAVGTAYYTDERAQIYQFSDSYMDSPIVFFKRKDMEFSWKTLEDLRPYKIGIVKGYANSPEFDSADFLTKVFSRSEVLLLKKIILKQADLIVMDKFVGLYNIREKLFGYEKKILEPTNPPLFVHKLYLMFSKKKDGYLQKTEAFNRGLDIIRKNGEWDAILKKHGFE